MKEKIEEILLKSLESFPVNLSNFTVIIEKPKDDKLGDYASPVCFQLSKILKCNPKTLAETLAKSIKSSQFKITDKNGFINFTLTEEYTWSKFKSLTFESLEKKSNKKYLLEYISANPTGPLHIGHARWAVIGSVLYNILNYAGFDVEQEFYINDAGQQVKNFYNSIEAIQTGKDIPENGYHGQYMHDLAKVQGDPLESNIKDQQQDLSSLKVNIKNWFHESQLHKENKIDVVIKRLKSLRVTCNIDGALWLKTTQFGDCKDRVLVKKDGSYTYFAVDIAYHMNKLERPFTHLINIWGADHHGYVARVRAAIIALMGPSFNVDEQFKVILGQLVSLKKDGQNLKMSKRSGELITLKEVLNDIGSDAIRYFLSQSNPNTHIEFDLDLAKLQNNENPIYYIQYAHARIQSILKNCELEHLEITSVELNNYERNLVKHCLQFKENIEIAANNFSTQVLCQYTYNLAKHFHTFYETCPILKAAKSLQNQRLIILMKVRQVLQKCLEILDISAPNSM